VLVFLEAPDEPGGMPVASSAGPRRFGVALVVLLAAELAWALRQVRGADLPPVDALPDRGPAVIIQSLLFDHPSTLLLIGVLVVVAVVGTARLVRREAR